MLKVTRTHVRSVHPCQTPATKPNGWAAIQWRIAMLSAPGNIETRTCEVTARDHTEANARASPSDAPIVMTRRRNEPNAADGMRNATPMIGNNAGLQAARPTRLTPYPTSSSLDAAGSPRLARCSNRSVAATTTKANPFETASAETVAAI